jgi:hypothetical protein
MAAVGVALSSDNLKCLKLLLEGHPVKGKKRKPKTQFEGWNGAAVLTAAKKGYAECVALAVAHGCPWYTEVRGLNPGHTSTFAFNTLFSQHNFGRRGSSKHNLDPCGLHVGRE